MSESLKILVEAIEELWMTRNIRDLFNPDEELEYYSDNELWQILAEHYQVSVKEMRKRLNRADQVWDQIMKGER